MNSAHTSLGEAIRLREQIFVDPAIDDMYAESDHLRRNQTKHDKGHGLEVTEKARKIADLVETRKPGTISEWDREVVIPLAAFLHDIGGAADNHDIEGARRSHKYLKSVTLAGTDRKLPKDIVRRICRIVALHRSRSVMKRKMDDAAWAVVVIADKCVGDEERVRPFRAFMLSLLTLVRMSWIPLRKGGVHDRANFAIKHTDLAIDRLDIVLHLTVDTRVCQPSLIHELYRDRFRSCNKAANFLGFEFRLELNGVRHGFCEKNNAWTPVETLRIR